ncbi:hypothetical protein [Microcoleus sp. PH2017_28_MFU_U_A]|uniref:hypothetical protein n=1 Tax=Microcoleus sp. PH2017_28_MFU_U_A TaxID=2798838 RepID=UPI001D1B2DD8|nr:hypothetical protein [Microcoleus sp. PH2017_28_MFU_U_A]MCC3592960.1 WD40 repeat domain-containing protein [Microcoleus sp. PH2017_28_MFU_U_A]
MSDLSVWLAQQSKSEREYLLKYQPRDFVEGLREFGRYYDWMTDFGFIKAKLELSGVKLLIEDYDLARISDVFLSEGKTETLKLIQGAIRKSAHILERDKTQFAGQLLGRLLDFEAPEIQGLLEQAKQSKDSPWLRPLRGNLERANEGALRTLVGHTSGVRGVAIAPDGKTAISASDDNMKIWDTESGTQLRTLTGHSSSVSAVAIAPDGLTAISASGDNTLKIWDIKTGTALKTLTGHSSSVSAVAIAPDGKTAISASYDSTLKIWDTESATELRTLTGHTGWVTAVAIAPDGKTAISASDSEDSTLKIWDIESGTELRSRTVTGHVDLVSGMEISPNGQTVHVSRPPTRNNWAKAVAIAPDSKTAISASGDKTVKIWDTESCTELRTLTGHTSEVNAVAIAPDGKTAISASGDKTVKIWDTESYTELRTLIGHTSEVNAVAIAPDGKTAISASLDNTLKIWDLLSGKELASFSGEYGFNCCAILPDGVTVVAGDRSGRVHFLRLEGVSGGR